MDLKQVAGLAPDHQEMSSPTNRENWGRRSDNTINRTTTGGRTDPPTQGEENGHRTYGVGGYIPVPPAPTQTKPGPIQGGGDGNTKRMKETLPRRSRAAAVARLVTTEGRTPTQTGQCVFNNDTHFAERRGGQAPWGGGAQEEEGR